MMYFEIAKYFIRKHDLVDFYYYNYVYKNENDELFFQPFKCQYLCMCQLRKLPMNLFKISEI